MQKNVNVKNIKEYIKKVYIYMIYIYNIYKYKYIYNDVMKTIQCTHPPHHQKGFVVTCRLCTASGRVHALLVLERSKALG